MSDLAHYFYLSSARGRTDGQALARILESSRRNNARVGVSGLLLYKDGTFIQYLEGPAAAVEETRARIAKDHRHTGVIRLSDGPAVARLFPDWSMGFEEAARLDRLTEAGFALDAGSLATHVPETLPALLRTMMQNVYGAAA